MSDKRQYARKSIAARVFIGEEAEEGRFWFDSRDISLGGLFLVSDFLLEEKDIITLELTLPAVDHTIRAKGEVVHVYFGDQANPDLPAQLSGMGVRFVDLNRKDRQAIERFVAGERKAAAKPAKPKEKEREPVREKGPAAEPPKIIVEKEEPAAPTPKPEPVSAPAPKPAAKPAAPEPPAASVSAPGNAEPLEETAEESAEEEGDGTATPAGETATNSGSGGPLAKQGDKQRVAQPTEARRTGKPRQSKRSGKPQGKKR